MNSRRPRLPIKKIRLKDVADLEHSASLKIAKEGGTSGLPRIFFGAVWATWSYNFIFCSLCCADEFAKNVQWVFWDVIGNPMNGTEKTNFKNEYIKNLCVSIAFDMLC